MFSRRKRPTRAAALKMPITTSERLRATLRDRGVLLRLLLCFVAMVGVFFAVQGWQATFPYRLGDRVDNGITAQIAFQRINKFETERSRAEAERQVPFVFVNDSESMEGLPARLRSAFGEIAQAESPDQLTPATRAAFGLKTTSSSSDQGAAEKTVVRQFQTLKAAVAKEEGTAGNRIDDLVAEFQQFIQPLKKYGVADPREISRLQIRSDQTIAVVAAKDRSQRVIVSPSDVQLPELLKETGRLGKSWAKYPELVVTRPLLERWLLSQVPVTLRYDGNATQQALLDARDRVPPVTDSYNPGDPLLPPGDVIDAEVLTVLQAQYDTMNASMPLGQRLTRSGITFLMILVLTVLNAYYLIHNERKLIRSIGRLSVYLSVIVLTILLGRLLYGNWRAEVVPLAVTAMLFTIAYNQEFATLTTFTLAIVLTFSTSTSLMQFVILMSVSATAIILLPRVSARSTLIKIGFVSGAVYFLVSLGTGIITEQWPGRIWSDSGLFLHSLWGAGWCLVSGYLVAGSLPFLESVFGVVTDISLLELGDVSHPLLQELVRRAPGTYNHSISVASIGETAADRIGANGLMVRVGAYFHDIGKMLKPQYFIENMTEGSQSRHEHLAPAMSTLIIIGHVKDGVELAHQHNLQPRLIDFIEQHHGTTLVAYFYHAATQQAGRKPDHKTDAEESSFRYPGPKPQTREAGVMMLADAVESASRTLSDPTPKRIETLVHELTMSRLLDGQFDECELTLSEIHTVEDSLAKSLIGIYHGRIKYPEQRTA